MATPLNFQFQSPFLNPSTAAFSQTSFAGAQVSGFGAVGGGGGVAGMLQLLQQMMQSLSLLSQGWNGMLGSNPGFGNPGFGNPGLGNPGFGTPGFGTPGFGTGTPGFGAPTTPRFVVNGPYNPGTPVGTINPPVTGGGGLYGGGGGGGSVGAPTLPGLRDPGDYSSYLQAQVAGGALSGNTTVRQSDMIPGTRFAQVQPAQLWHANVGRLYAYQFAAQAAGFDPLSAQGLAGGANALQQMKPEAALFAQVASVFKGNLMNGPGFYDNAGLKNLLIQAGRSDLASGQNVGATDVQTVGAVTRAIQEGSLTLDQIIQSGTIDNLDRYQHVIQYVSGGQFAADTSAYDNYPI